LRALRAKYTSNRASVIWQIDANLGTARSAIAAHQTLFNNNTPVLIDEAQMVTAELGATRQFEAFVIGPAPLWQLAYRGPLDNADPAGTSAPTINHVADAVAAVLSGKTPASAQVALSTAAPLIALASPSINYPTDVAPIVSPALRPMPLGGQYRALHTQPHHRSAGPRQLGARWPAPKTDVPLARGRPVRCVYQRRRHDGRRSRHAARLGPRRRPARHRCRPARRRARPASAIGPSANPT
jgi:hypothetical protein